MSGLASMIRGWRRWQITPAIASAAIPARKTGGDEISGQRRRRKRGSRHVGHMNKAVVHRFIKIYPTDCSAILNYQYSSSSGHCATHLAWRMPDERRNLDSSHQSLPQLPQATVEMRSVSTELPEMFILRCRMSGIWQAVQMEQWSRESGEDDGKVV